MKSIIFIFAILGLSLAAAPYKHIGCYKDKGVRDLPKFIGNLSNNSVEVCGAKCEKAGYKFFSEQFGKQCFCGNKYGKYGKATNCNKACPKKKVQEGKCGGKWANSVWVITSVSLKEELKARIAEKVKKAIALGTSVVKTAVEKVARSKKVLKISTPFVFKGCFKDTAVRDLPVWKNDVGTNGPKACAALCKGYSYFGLQYTTQCFCGDNEKRAYGKAENCDAVCPEAKGGKCGGTWANSVYQLNKPAPSKAAMAAAAAVHTKATAALAQANKLVGKVQTEAQVASVVAIIKKVFAPAAVAPVPTGKQTFTSVGCFKDTETRDMEKNFGESNDNKKETCGQKCGDKGFKFFGLQFSGQCFCSEHASRKYGNATNCDMPCSGDSDQMCGGDWANSVYEVVRGRRRLMSALQTVKKTFKKGQAKKYDDDCQSACEEKGRVYLRQHKGSF